MSLYKHFHTDTELEVGGRWFDINPANDDGTKPGFLMARRSSKNTRFQAAMERVIRQNKRDLDNGTMTPEDSRQIMVETFVDTVLRDWRNIEGSDGELMAFNRANALKLFTDLPDLFDTLNEQAGLIINYQDKLIEAAGKN